MSTHSPRHGRCPEYTDISSSQIYGIAMILPCFGEPRYEVNGCCRTCVAFSVAPPKVVAIVDSDTQLISLRTVGTSKVAFMLIWTYTHIYADLEVACACTRSTVLCSRTESLPLYIFPWSLPQPPSLPPSLLCVCVCVPSLLSCDGMSNGSYGLCGCISRVVVYKRRT